MCLHSLVPRWSEPFLRQHCSNGLSPTCRNMRRPSCFHITLRRIMKNKKRVLFLCTGNSARSQMAEGLLRHLGGDRFEVHSAGTNPSTVRPEAVAAMGDLGIDISHQWSKSVEEFKGRGIDYLITVCDAAREVCPVFPGSTSRLHWSFEDPAAVKGSYEDRLAAFRRIRDQIQERLRVFLAETEPGH